MSATIPAVTFIDGAVGAVAASNNLVDVLWLQGLLNRWLATGKHELLSLDGSFGKGTAAAITEFQRAELKLEKPTGKIAPGDATATRLMLWRPALKIIPGKDFIAQADGVELDKVLLSRVVRLGQCLIDIGLVSGNITLNQGVRSPKVAHRWSTSWNIRQGYVTLAALQGLKDGKDLDGNLWYDVAWEKSLAIKGDKGALNEAATKELWAKIKVNASTYYASDAIAAEGYALNDKRIKPNGHKAVSNHTAGRAIDASFPWKAGAKVFGKAIVKGAVSEEPANRIVRAFGLSRPVKSERWHFQLPSDDSRGFVSQNNLTLGGPSTEMGPQGS